MKYIHKLRLSALMCQFNTRLLRTSGDTSLLTRDGKQLTGASAAGKKRRRFGLSGKPSRGAVKVERSSKPAPERFTCALKLHQKLIMSGLSLSVGGNSLSRVFNEPNLI